MGVWITALGRLEVVPMPDDDLLVNYWKFSQETWPEDYKKMDEYFFNTWFFDENNKLTCTAGKFAEPIVWLEWLKKHFFEPRGYELIGEPNFAGECEVDVFDRNVEREYYLWLDRLSQLNDSIAFSIEKRYGDVKKKVEEIKPE